VTGRTLKQVEEDIHRERLANLEPPELGELLDEYLARMVRENGTTYTEAAVERYQGAPDREALAVKDAGRELRRFKLPRRRVRPAST